MASKSAAARRPAGSRKIIVRKISDEDLRLSLKQGLDDFRDLRGDIFFAGLIYTFIGIAAVVMTNNGPLVPFLFPIVAGVGLARAGRRGRLLRTRPPPRERPGSRTGSTSST